LKDKLNLKIFHLVFIWLFIFGISYVIYLARGGHLNEAEIEKISYVFIYMFLIELTVILIQASFSVSSLIMKIYFKVHEIRRKKIEKNTFSWISDEKIGNVSELITTLNLRNKDFDIDCKTSADRYNYIKIYIRESWSNHEVRLWHSQLKVKDKNKDLLSFIIAIVFSYSAIKEIISFIPRVYTFMIEFYSAFKLIGVILFAEIVMLIFIILWGLVTYVRYDSRMTSFFTVILGDIMEDIKKESA